MASSAAPHYNHHNHHQDGMITIKVNYQGFTRKCKLPLRDMVPGVLEEKLRVFIGVPHPQDLLFERYSDSASSYVALNPVVATVWKQLNRAAKAKTKLKIRVSDRFDPSLDHNDDQFEQPVAKAPEPSSGIEKTVTTTTTTTTTTVEDARDTDVRPSEPTLAPAATNPPATHNSSIQAFTVCCNRCDLPIPSVHYHCSICDDGDYDLCPGCIASGVRCLEPQHTLTHRTTVNGQFVYNTGAPLIPANASVPSSAIKVEPKALGEPLPALPSPPREPVLEPVVPVQVGPVPPSPSGIRTCNSCVRDFPEKAFVHCLSCADYDVCYGCFMRDSHGHHPGHEFVTAVPTAHIDEHLAAKMAPGRNVAHQAICDGCDKFIAGVRHKCLDCPDWDYCSDCIVSASYTHNNHRFVPIYEALQEVRSLGVRSTHVGICCDGPHCHPTTQRVQDYITGVRYKCAVCHDTDFCAVCEASPVNTHNRTHPLIKFKTPVRHVSVTTHGENEYGDRLKTMGDRRHRTLFTSPSVSSGCRTLKNLQSVVDVKPIAAEEQADNKTIVKDEPVFDETETEAESLNEPEIKQEPKAAVAIKEEPKEPEVKEEVKEEEPKIAEEIKEEPKEEPKEATKAAPVPVPVAVEPTLMASFVSDVVADGTEFAPNTVFEQTWMLCNTGATAWPAGCSVKFVGGDYMGHVDSNRPAGVLELVSASESTLCFPALEAGRVYPFTVFLRAPPSEGKFTSYWRLSTKTGHKFGDRLWCDIVVRAPKAPVTEDVDAIAAKMQTSMVFPKLEAESPASSVLAESPAEPAEMVQAPSVTDADDFEECDDLDEWDASEDEFETDEEYDILDASDEELSAPEDGKKKQQ